MCAAWQYDKSFGSYCINQVWTQLQNPRLILGTNVALSIPSAVDSRDYSYDTMKTCMNTKMPNQPVDFAQHWKSVF
jgi:hypothetical protein